jgi:CheY-like chemotaxis protein
MSTEILIVDDDTDMCWALEHLLRRHGFIPFQALSAQKALDLMSQHCFSWALLDAKLPDMDGLELARRIRTMAPETHILMVSGYFYSHDIGVQEAIAQGLIVDFISKPFLQDEILAALKKLGFT